MSNFVLRKFTQTNQTGQSMVEVAISLVIILMLLAAAVDLGMAFFSYVAIRDAAQEGAIYGALHPTDWDTVSGTNQCADGDCIENRIRQSSATPVNLADTANVTIAITITKHGGSCAGAPIKVTVTYNYRITMPLTSSILRTNTIPIRASATDTILQGNCPP